jgi:hypothetical protein
MLGEGKGEEYRSERNGEVTWEFIERRPDEDGWNG